MPEKKPVSDEKPTPNFGEYELHISPVPGIREPFEQRYLVSKRDKEAAETIGIPESLWNFACSVQPGEMPDHIPSRYQVTYNLLNSYSMALNSLEVQR